MKTKIKTPLSEEEKQKKYGFAIKNLNPHPHFLPLEKQKELCRLLVEGKTYFEIIRGMKLMEVYKSESSCKNAVHYLKTKLQADPEKYGCAKEEVVIMNERTAHRLPIALRNYDKSKLKDRELVTSISRIPYSLFMENKLKGVELLTVKAMKRLDDKLSQSKNTASIQQLAWTVVHMLRLSRLFQGFSTENISIYAKIDVSGMSKDEKMKALLKIREDNLIKDENK